MLIFAVTILAILSAVSILLLLAQYLIRRRSFWNNYRFRLTSLSQSMSSDAIYEHSNLVEEARSEGDKKFLIGGFITLHRQSGVTQPLYFYGIVAALLSVLLFILLTRAIGAPTTRVFVAIPMAGFLVYYYLRTKRKKRIRAFVEKLPDTLEVIVRSLRAGHPLNAGLRLVAEEMPEPIGPEFETLVSQVSLGSAVDTALVKMFIRVGAPEIKLLAVTVSVQSGTGGNLAEVLENMSDMIRQRLMLQIKAQAITAEGRASATIMSLFPAILFGILMSLSPSYFDPLIESGYATYFAALCITLVALGVFVLFRIVSLDI